MVENGAIDDQASRYPIKQLQATSFGEGASGLAPCILVRKTFRHMSGRINVGICRFFILKKKQKLVIILHRIPLRKRLLL